MTIVNTITQILNQVPYLLYVFTADLYKERVRFLSRDFRFLIKIMEVHMKRETVKLQPI